MTSPDVDLVARQAAIDRQKQVERERAARGEPPPPDPLANRRPTLRLAASASVKTPEVDTNPEDAPGALFTGHSRASLVRAS
jgi:hypothetical protein